MASGFVEQLDGDSNGARHGCEYRQQAVVFARVDLKLHTEFKDRCLSSRFTGP
jgi:hypothetical protein